jgi:hypothetical protein
MGNCRWCGMMHGPMCYLVKAIEFFEDGVTVKRVEFKSSADYPSPKVDAAAGSPPIYTTYMLGT